MLSELGKKYWVPPTRATLAGAAWLPRGAAGTGVGDEVSAGWDGFHPAVPGADFPWTSATTYGTRGSIPKTAPSIHVRNLQ
ncbi:hypothetical protein NQZ68_039191 [Dissostichus eleginoides]|nr:hypothetical protein NQZ68_039191 [Dissostichus eleginoides]